MTKLRVERAVKADGPEACALARAAHEESMFSDISFSEAKFYKSFQNILNDPNRYLGLKVTLGNRIVGFCYAMLGEYYIGDDVKVVTVITIAVSPDIRSKIVGGKAALRLTRGIEIWAKGMGASYVLYHATSGTNPTSSDRFFRKLGMSTLGGNYGVKIHTNLAD